MVHTTQRSNSNEIREGHFFSCCTDRLCSLAQAVVDFVKSLFQCSCFFSKVEEPQGARGRSSIPKLVGEDGKTFKPGQLRQIPEEECKEGEFQTSNQDLARIARAKAQRQAKQQAAQAASVPIVGTQILEQKEAAIVIVMAVMEELLGMRGVDSKQLDQMLVEGVAAHNRYKTEEEISNWDLIENSEFILIDQKFQTQSVVTLAESLEKQAVSKSIVGAIMISVNKENAQPRIYGVTARFVSEKRDYEYTVLDLYHGAISLKKYKKMELTGPFSRELFQTVTIVKKEEEL